MSNKDDGGPAFPAKVQSSTVFYNHETRKNEYLRDGMPGMMLRDYFAAKALQGVAAYDNAGDWDDDRIARWCYEQADAMLKARKS
jgi:hypothetical protein